VPVVSLSTSSSTAPSEAVVALVDENYDVEAAMSSTASTAATSKAKVAALSAPARINKKVKFHLVHVREYGRTVGDHPEVKVGPPIALSWQYVTKSPVLVEAYDMERELNGRSGARGNHQVDRLTSIARKNLLLEYGYTEMDFRKAEVEVQLVREQRSMTKREVKADTLIAVAGDRATGVADHQDRSQRRRIGRSFRKNLMLSLSAAAKAMATPTMMAM
jgi:hypothetical protein